MKININNIEKVQEAISWAQAGCRARLFDMDRVKPAVEKAEKTLAGLKIAKKYWIGCRIHFQPEQAPNKYAVKGAAYGTYVTVERCATDWFLVHADRGRCEATSYGAPEREVLILSDNAKASIPAEWGLD